MSKLDQKRAERIALSYVLACGGRSPVQSGGTRYHRVDIWASDVVAFLAEGIIAVQVTTGGAEALYARRRKIEQVAWCCDAQIWLMQVRRAEGRAANYEYRMQRYFPRENRWVWWPVSWGPVPREWWDY